MYEVLNFFQSTDGPVAVALPFDHRVMVAVWADLRKRMIRHVPPSFSRDEWGYLLTFLDRQNLEQPFLINFGSPLDEGAKPKRLYRPCKPIAVWLPNNVSLLGPLILVLLSLTGQPLRLKLGSHGEDLAGEFLGYALENLDDGVLKRYLSDQVQAMQMDRDDPRQLAMAAESRIRIVFGSDEAVKSIDQMPHPVNSRAIHFADHQSEAWLEIGAIDEEVLDTLIRVFSIYGQAGCTSPARVVLLNGTEADALELQNRLAERWPAIQRQDPGMSVASANILADQLARAQGWNTRLAPRNAAMLATGSLDCPPFEGAMSLRIHAATPEEAQQSLPPNIQTIGHALKDPGDPHWLERIAQSPALRFVPLGEMHHFGTIWDGMEFFRQCFDCIEVRT